MCPDIKLYDFRVLAHDARGHGVRHHRGAAVHSLPERAPQRSRRCTAPISASSIPHDVRNFACGRTPICNECERLVESGVVVVAAAGNLGYHSFETKDGVVRGLHRLQHHRSGQRRRRDHGRRDASLLAAHLRRELLLEPRTDRRRPDEAGPRRAGRAHPVVPARTAAGASWTAPAWPRRTSAAPPRC